VTGDLGVLLAGGRGLRLGQPVPKALVTVGGRTLFERALGTLEEVCDEIVVTAPRQIELPDVHGIRRERLFDAGKGPLAAIVEALEHRSYSRALVLGVDFPLLLSPALRAILDLLAAERPVVVPAPAGRLQPLAAAYSPPAAKALAEAHGEGERSLVAAVLRLGPHLLHDAELARLPGGLESFLNLNRPEEKVEAENRLRQRASG
jgi:molybdopterin-guanine dinucleotide biosynthesis protein A